METFLSAHAPYAHWIIFGTLILGGFNLPLPISEDVLIILSAFLAAQVVPDHLVQLCLAVFLGCYLSDWICYWMGRKVGRKICESWKWAAKMFPPRRLEKMHCYYEKYGVWTLIVGRLIPLGVRPCLFLTAGMSKMHFGKFILSDAAACLCSNTALFVLAYTFSRNYQMLIDGLKTFNLFLLAAFVVTGISLFWYKRRNKNCDRKPD
jgi:membrane-associated protein